MSSGTQKKKSSASRISAADRVFIALAQAGEKGQRTGAGVLVAGQKRRLTFGEAEDFVARDLARWEADAFVPTEAGCAYAKRRMAPDLDDAHRLQHGDIARETAQGPCVERAESPLLWLRRRRGPDGNPLIGDAMFAAGERLRADFTYGNMGPRVTLNWSAAVQGSRNPHGAEPGETAMAARQRVRNALDRVGPELSGVLLDVCCFLKRLEDVERDRKWPARSAKVILGLGLERLASHYGYSDTAKGAASGIRSSRQAGARARSASA